MATADSNAFSVVIAALPSGKQEMYVKSGGTFVKHTPHVKVGGVWQEADAFVKSGGVWVPVHEKP